MERLIELRKNRGLLQKEVAKEIGVDRTTYVKYEKGDIALTDTMLIILADYFSVSVDYLLGRTDNPEVNK